MLGCTYMSTMWHWRYEPTGIFIALWSLKRIGLSLWWQIWYIHYLGSPLLSSTLGTYQLYILCNHIQSAASNSPTTTNTHIYAPLHPSTHFHQVASNQPERLPIYGKSPIRWTWCPWRISYNGPHKGKQHYRSLIGDWRWTWVAQRRSWPTGPVQSNWRRRMRCKCLKQYSHANLHIYNCI